MFNIDLVDYSVRPLSREDGEALRQMFEACEDYFLVVEGQAPPPGAAIEAFDAMPPGRSIEDKFIFGIFDVRAHLVGVLEGMRQYPDETTWWIGLLLLAPNARNRGLGEIIIRRFKSYVQRNGGRAIALGVVADNERALGFWRKLGFMVVRQTEPRRFGNKTQTIRVLQRIL